MAVATTGGGARDSADDNGGALPSSPIGRRVRELRHKLGLTQAELAGDDYSAAYVSTIETGRRTPSAGVLEYLAARLGVEVGDLSSERGATWAIELARDLRSGGRARAARDLLERCLTNLESAGRVPPGTLVVMHREIARAERGRDLGAAERHLEKALEYARRGPVAVTELALTYVELGDVRAAGGNPRGAAAAHRAAAGALLELLGRPVD
jgi:transcriptional regulator with XRE-family HTH domain